MTTNGKPTTTEEAFKFPEMAGLYGPAFGHGPWFYTCHRDLDDCLARLGLKLAQQRVATWMLWLSRERVDGQTVYGSSVSIGYKTLARGISVSTAQSAVHALVEKGLTPILQNGVGATEGCSGSATTYDLQPLRASLAKALAQLQDERQQARQRGSNQRAQRADDPKEPGDDASPTPKAQPSPRDLRSELESLSDALTTRGLGAEVDAALESVPEGDYARALEALQALAARRAA